MIIDLTLSIDNKTPNWPGDPEIVIRQFSTAEKDGIGKKVLTFHSHFATHIDAPSHMLANGKTLSDYPMEKFVGAAIVLDARGQQEVEANLGSVKEGDIVFFLTAHSDKVYEKSYFANNPVLSPKTAQELVAKKIKMVGLDAPTPDNEPYALHKLFFKHDILIIENLVNLKGLVGKRFQCYVLPLKIQDGDGAPCRVIAAID
ncbi:MAG: cyclase family protein [Candidatus Aenigmarchaeota archaeon]|nr:cyclase family protein [Candidatus Aenigmarchaeota archaeon]